MGNFFSFIFDYRRQKAEYLCKVADLLKRLQRDSKLVGKELDNYPDNEVDDDMKEIAWCGISLAISYGKILNYLKKVRLEPCWNFRNRDLFEDLKYVKPKFDQEAWNIIIDSCKKIEHRYGIAED